MNLFRNLLQSLQPALCGLLLDEIGAGARAKRTVS